MSTSAVASTADEACRTHDTLCSQCVVALKHAVEQMTFAEVQTVADFPVSATKVPVMDRSRFVFNNVEAESERGIHLAHAECFLSDDNRSIEWMTVSFRQGKNAFIAGLPRGKEMTIPRDAMPYLSDTQFNELELPFISMFSVDAEDIRDFNIK